jgi:stage II sporulation protein M
MLFMPREERRAYLARLIPYLGASLALFFLGLGGGVAVVYQIPDLADRFADNIATFVKGFTGMPHWQLAAAIFLNNSVKTLIALLLGALFGVVPVIFLFANGAALGVVFSLSIRTRGLWTSLASIAPHGVIELPAVFLGMSIGLMLGAQTLARIRRRCPTPIRTEIGLALRYFCTVIAPLLMLAALIEVFVTAALVGRVD